MNHVEDDAGRLLGEIMQLQILHRQGRLALPLRMKWMPAAPRDANAEPDIGGVFAHLQPLLKIDLNRVGRGADLPAGTAEHLYGFHRALVRLRLVPDAGKADQAEEILEALAEELDAAEQAAAAPETAEDDSPNASASLYDLETEWQRADWLRMYRVLRPASDPELAAVRDIAQYLARCDAEVPPGDRNTLALVTWLAKQRAAEDVERVLLDWVRTGLDYPQRWTWLRGDAVRELLATQLDESQRREFVLAGIRFLLTSEREAVLRLRLLADWLEQFPEARGLLDWMRGLVLLERRSGTIHPELLAAIEVRGSAGCEPMLPCLRFEDGQAASADAQFLIGRLLAAHDIACQPAFRRFCRRIAAIELTVGLRTELSERVLNNTKRKQALIARGWSSEQLVDSFRSATDSRRQLFYLLLLALRQFEGAVLGEITRALSLIDVAVRQTKIDGRHVQLLMDDLRRDPGEGLLTLVDEARIDRKAGESPELSLLYLNLRLISQTSGRADAVDIEDLSRTLRKLKLGDARGRGA